MARPVPNPLAPHNTGSSTPSTLSSSTNYNYATSTLTSYTTSTKSDESSHRPGDRSRPTIPSQSQSRRKVPALKTSSSQGALSAARSAANHAKLHKRGDSASSTKNLQMIAFPAFDADCSATADYNSIVFPPLTYQDTSTPPTLLSKRSNSKVKIKPLLRRLASHEKNSIDLSRSAAENEGLGIYTSSATGGEGRNESDVGYNTGGRRPYHAHTVSGGSHISTVTTSSVHRPGAQYVHPMRQTPRPFTPPIAHSHQNSRSTSDTTSPKASDISEERQRSRSDFHNPSHAAPAVPYAPLPFSQRTPPPLHVRTYSSSRLTSSSQTNLPGTPSSLRQQTDYPRLPDTMPHTARSSFESAFHKRSRTNTNTDPNAQLAAVQALRAEFNAREAAKELKYQEAEAKTQEKEARKRERQTESIRRKSEAQERKRARSKSNATSEKSVPLSAGGYSTVTAQHLDEVEYPSLHNPARPRRGRTATAGSAGKAVSSQWSLFWFKFKTMLMKFKRSMRIGSRGG